jgi:hypothetical protein
MLSAAFSLAVLNLKMLAQEARCFREPFQVIVQALDFDCRERPLGTRRVSSQSFEHFRFHEDAYRIVVNAQQCGRLLDREPSR